MRWNPPETIPLDLDEPIRIDAGMLFIGLWLVGAACSVLILIVALVSAALRVLGWS